MAHTDCYGSGGSQMNTPARVPLFDIRFAPAWSYLDGIRDFIGFFFTTGFDATLAGRLQLVAHELLENAIKYSLDEASTVELSISRCGERMEVSVANDCPENARARLVEELAELARQSPDAGYRMAVSRAGSAPTHTSRLGLARIRFEAGFELTAQQDTASRVRLVATGKI
jgi:hypothetical protein